ncbi:MAG: beta-cystathionase [Bacillaceae bacterium]|nr:beta-cystathionase [Bacillaceae bacterium]
MTNRFDQIIDRRGTYCTQWDYIEDRFGKRDLLPFSISDTDFRCPPEILRVLEARLNHGVFGYTRWNHADFKGAVRGWFQRQFSCPVDEDWIVYSPSVVYSISKLLEILTEEGDRIVLQTPAYDAFFKVIRESNRVLSANPLKNEDGVYRIDFADLEKKLADERAKVLLLCSPHNPTGRVWTEEELKTVIRLCEQYRVYLISDEIHMDIVFGPRPHLPILNVSEELNHVMVCSSASKTFNIPGLGGSYTIIPDPSIRERFLNILKNRDGLSSASIFGMLATIAGYNHCSQWVKELADYIHGNMIAVEDFIRTHLPGVKFRVPESTFLAWIDVSGLSHSSEALQHALVHHAKVAIMPGETYGSPGKGFLRMNVGCPRAKVVEGLRRLKKAVEYLEENK